MNVNCKVSLTDEQRNVMFRRLTGKNGKGMVSRADVNNWVKDQIERFLTLGSPTTELVIDEEAISKRACGIAYDEDDIEIGEILKQNMLLLNRVNRLQHMLDTRK